MALRAWRVELADANDFVRKVHRHHAPEKGHRFSLGVGDTELRGVAICGRPKARGLSQRDVLEVTRVATDGARNACSWLYSAAARIAEEMGVDEKTLRKNFSRELHAGLLHVEGMILDVLMLKVRQGHVPSVRLLMEMVQTTAPRAPKGDETDDEDEAGDAARAPARLGKKEQRDEEAQLVPSEYGDLYARLRRPS